MNNMRPKSIKINCSLFTKLFLVKEAKLLNQEVNLHINAVIDQHLQQRPIKNKELGLIGFFINPILTNCQNDLVFIPVKPLEEKLARYKAPQREVLLEKTLSQYVLSHLYNKVVIDSHVQIAIETLEELEHWEEYRPS